MAPISKSDRQLLAAISSAADDASRQIIINHLDKNAQRRLMKHLKGLVLQNRRVYRLEGKEKIALSRVLEPHKRLLRKHLLLSNDNSDDDDDDDGKEKETEGQTGRGSSNRNKRRRKRKKLIQRGGWVFSTIVSALLPVVSSLISKAI